MITQELFNKNIDRLLPSNVKRIAIALSGGSDSMALTLLSNNWAKKKNIDLIAITIDHNLRKNSAKEALKVASWMQKRKINHTILTYKGIIPTSNIEAIARQYRYDMLFDYCKKHNIEYLLIAHNADEQTETFFLNLSRGSGVYGLSCMPDIQNKNDIKIIRPMLLFSKEEIKSYLKDEKQKWVEDPSNKDTKYKRVRIRKIKKLLNTLELSNERISKIIDNMQRTRDTIEFYVNEFIKQNVIINDKVLINIEDILNYPKEIVIRALSKILKDFSKKIYPPRLENLENIYYKIIHNDLKKGITLFNNKIYNKDNKIIIEKEMTRKQHSNKVKEK